MLSLGLVNFAYQLDTRFSFTLEPNLNRLFESNTKAEIPYAPDAQIIFHDTPYISYLQITLTDNFLVYANGVLRARGALKTGVLLDPYQQGFEVNKWIQSIKIDFKGLNRQIEWLETYLVYHKTDQHLTIYDGYDVELAAKFIKKITLENVQKTYSLTGKIEYDLTNPEDKHWLYEMFVAYFFGKESSMTPITKYMNNEIKQDMIKEKKYFTDESDEKIFIDLRHSKGYTDRLEELSGNDADIDLTILLTKAAEKKWGSKS